MVDELELSICKLSTISPTSKAGCTRKKKHMQRPVSQLLYIEPEVDWRKAKTRLKQMILIKLSLLQVGKNTSIRSSNSHH